jgi:hypothetical protein
VPLSGVIELGKCGSAIECPSELIVFVMDGPSRKKAMVQASMDRRIGHKW